MMDLKDTIDLMTSEDYKERFKAEYQQLEIRLDKLTTMLDKWDKNELDFTPNCPRELYNQQVSGMVDYLNVLRTRADIEGIKL
ncbi:MAG: hypothetical protein K6F91_01715 [Ruminococcus sp.]|nr:hypothetical protein [Ruminococcus sp.]